RSNRVHGPIKIVGLAGQKNCIEGPIQLTLLYGLDRCTELTAVLCFYYQTFPLKLGGALRPDEKSHVSAAFDKHSAKVSPERAGAQYQVPHLLPPIYALCGHLSMRHRCWARGCAGSEPAGNSRAGGR